MNLFYSLPHAVQGVVISHILLHLKIHRQPLLDALPFYHRYICKATPRMLTIVHNARLTHREAITVWYYRSRVFYSTEVALNLRLLLNLRYGF